MTIHPDDPVIRITTTPAITVSSRATLREAAQTLTRANVGALVVLAHEERAMAIVSERDLTRALAIGADPDEVWAADVMSEQPRYATPAQSIRSAAEEMLASGIRHLPVMEDGEVVGMVAARDALRVLTEGLHAPATPVQREMVHPVV